MYRNKALSSKTLSSKSCVLLEGSINCMLSCNSALGRDHIRWLSRQTWMEGVRKQSSESPIILKSFLIQKFIIYKPSVKKKESQRLKGLMQRYNLVNQNCLDFLFSWSFSEQPSPLKFGLHLLIPYLRVEYREYRKGRVTARVKLSSTASARHQDPGK